MMTDPSLPRPPWPGHPVLLILLLLAALGSPCSTNAEEEAVLEAVDIADLPGNRIQLRFQFSKPPPEPRHFTIADPARIVLDFPAARSGLRTRSQTIGSGVAQDLSVLEGKDRTRATLRLARTVPFSLRTQGNIVLLTLEAPAAAPASPLPTAERPSPALTPQRTVTHIDFRRGPQGQAIINITLSDPTISVDVREEGNEIIADVLNATLPRGQERRLDVTDFATPVNFIDALNRGHNARIIIQPTGRYEYLAYQMENLYTIEVKPIAAQPDRMAMADEPTFVGEELSLNFQDIEVRAVLQIIADFIGLNMVVDDSVDGNLTLRLQNVPWDQALDIVLRTRGLTMRQSGNVMYVAPVTKIAEQERARQQVAEALPLRSELIQVNYANAADLGNLIKSEEASLLSPRGQVTVDDRTNTLLVHDIADNLSQVRSLITRLDVPVRQVMIDSRIVIATDDFSKELGVRFGVTGVRRHGDDGIITTTGSAQGTDTIVGSAVDNLIETGQPFPVTLPPLSDRLGVNLGTFSSPFGRLALAILDRDYLLDLELSALQAEGRGEILSNPRVITTDRYPATIKQGREIPYQTRTLDTVVTQFRDAVLELTVTPQITPDNQVILNLHITKNEQGRDVPSGLEGGFIPTIDKREITTQVLVSNGETVVLGGVFEQITNNQLDKVPLLGDLPAVGRLFQRKANRDSKFELLIFVTPQIIAEDMVVR